MPANVESMFYAGQAPWHGLGTRVPEDLPSGRAIVCAGLNWDVRKEAVGLTDGQTADDYRAIVRQSDRRILSVMGASYEPIQNSEIFAFGDALAGNGVRYHTAGSLDGGRRVWALMKSPKTLRLFNGDEIEPFILLSSSHNGSLAFSVGPTAVRTVCQNTLSLALRGMRSKFTVRHTRNLQGRVEEARKALGLTDRYFEKFSEVAEALARLPYGEAQLKVLVETLFPADQESGEVSAQANAKRERVSALFSEGKGHGRLADSGWKAWNALAEWSDHFVQGRKTERMSAAESRLASTWFPTSPELIVPLVSFLQARAKAQRSARIRTSLEQARAEGRCGRPRKTIPPEAIAAVESGERLAHVARRFQLGETTLRRAVALHRAQKESEARGIAA